MLGFFYARSAHRQKSPKLYITEAGRAFIGGNMKTVKQATGHDILASKNFWQPDINGAEIASVGFTIGDDVDLDLSINAIGPIPGFSRVLVSVSREPGDFLNPIDMEDYSNGSIDIIELTTHKDAAAKPHDFEFRNGQTYGIKPLEPLLIGKGKFYINVKLVDEKGQHSPKITVGTDRVVIGGQAITSATKSQPTQLDRIEYMLKQLVSD